MECEVYYSIQLETTWTATCCIQGMMSIASFSLVILLLLNWSQVTLIVLPFICLEWIALVWREKCTRTDDKILWNVGHCFMIFHSTFAIHQSCPWLRTAVSRQWQKHGMRKSTCSSQKRCQLFGAPLNREIYWILCHPLDNTVLTMAPHGLV